MEKRSPSVAARLTVALWAAFCLPLAAMAENVGNAEQEADWAARLDKAATLQAESRMMKDAAKQALEEKTPACSKKFMVNACRNELRQEYLKASHEAQRLESEGKAIEREVKREQIAEREKRSVEEAPQREAELKARAAETEAARQATQARIEATRADKEKKAEEGVQRKAADAERLRQKQEAHARKVAEKMREAEQREQEAAKKEGAKP